MIIVMKQNAEIIDIEGVALKLKAKGLTVHISEGVSQIIIGVIGDKSKINPSDFEALSGVKEVILVTDSHKLSNRVFHPQDTVIKVELKNKTIEIGGNKVQVMAGPCAVESSEQIMRIAKGVSESGAEILRGGAYKPRTSPYDFQGLGVEGLKMMREAADAYNLAVVTEVLDENDIEIVSEYADILQVGARNMYNYSLLRALGKTNKPILLKRGLSATLKEWILASEYILSEGNKSVIFCERGIRTFEPATRNTFDINAIPYLKTETHLPVCADPSHGTGKRNLVIPVARASVASGADVVMIETHFDPYNAKSDAVQTISLESFAQLMNELKIITSAIGRTI